MAGLAATSVNAPGFKGLNKQQSASLLPIEWATDATNCIIDTSGRIAARKGWAQQTTTPISGTPDVEQVFEYINGSGVSTIISSAGGKLYSGVVTLTDRTGTLTPSANNWQFCNFNGKVVGFQDGETPIVWAGSGNFANITFTYPTTGTNTFGNAGLAAYGRLWAFDSTHTVLKYSDLLVETSWTADDGSGGDAGGSAGVVDLKAVWTYGMDSGVAIAAFNGFLLIFGKTSILIYSGADDPTTMKLVENIRGIGCAARDSIQDIGTDLLFLSNSGIRSLGRTIQEKSAPISDESKNVHDYLLSYLAAETSSKIRSVYSEENGFYLVSFPSTGTTFCFDIRVKLEDGSRRVTIWNSITPTAMCYTIDNIFYMGQPGVIGKYDGYVDGTNSYHVSYYSGWVNLSDREIFYILKKIKYVFYTGANISVGIKWAFDFTDVYDTISVAITGGSIAEYGIAQYNIDSYSGAVTLVNSQSSPSGTGKVIQFGIELDVSSSFSIQRLELLAKLGRIN